MQNFENEKIEFKSQFSESIYKEVIAFANTDGGIIYVGIDNNGNVSGIENIDQEYTRITNGIRDAIFPDVTMFVRFSIQDNKVVQISVNEGTNKPYYLKSKGMKPGGVFVRQGTSSVPASSEQIRQMIKECDGDVYEEMRSKNQDLTFDAAKKIFKEHDVSFNKQKYNALGLTQGDIFTNLAEIISDQCEHTIKIAVFSDDHHIDFVDRKEFGGSVFEQLEETFSYLKLCNKKAASFDGLYRIDKMDYPEEALREALINAVIHRDYGYSGSILIKINKKEIQFISIGGLLPGISKEEILNGVSQLRNSKLANIFHRLNFIEAYGTGIEKIFDLYEDSYVKPEINVTPNSFKIILPNKNTSIAPALHESSVIYMTTQMQEVLDYVHEHGEITDEIIGKMFEIKSTRIFEITKQMRDIGILKVVGRGKNKKYVLN